MKGRLLVIALAALCLSAPPAGAQQTEPELQKPITLDQALEIAFCQSPDIRIAVGQLQRGEAVLAEARAGFNPRFNAQAVHQRQGPEVTVTIPGMPGAASLVTAQNTTARLNVLLPLDISNRLQFATDVARYRFQIDYLGLSRTARQLILDVQRAYYDLLRAQGQEEVSQAAVDVALARLRDAQARFEAGTAPRFDVTRAQVEVANLNQQLISSRSRVAVARAALNRVLGIDVNSPTAVVRTDIAVRQDVRLDIPERVEVALVQRPEVLQAQTTILANQANVRLQRAELYPSLVASAQATYNVEATGFAEQNLSWIALLDLNVPIWNGGITRARINQARADVNIATDTLEQTRLRVALEVRSAALSLQEAIERVSTAGENVVLAEEALRLATVRYEAGIATLVEVTDAESALTEARFNVVNAQYDYALFLAELERATGTQPELNRLQLLCPTPAAS